MQDRSDAPRSKPPSKLRLVRRLALYHLYRQRSRPSPARHVFVVGAPRSGTSLIETVITRHPEFSSVGQETGFFTPNFILDTAKNWGGLRGKIAGTLKSRSLTSLFDEFAAHTLAALGVPSATFVEKTPQHVKHLKFILWAYPNARVINVLRDPRDCYASTRDHPALRSWSAARYARYHNRCIDARMKQGADPRILDVRYSHFVSAPEQGTTRIMQFLGHEPDPAQSGTSTASHDTRAQNRAFARLAQPVTATSDGRWKQRISADDARVITRISGPRLDLIRSPEPLAGSLENTEDRGRT